MKIHHFSQSRQRGVALVIVLSVLVLMSALVIGFMSSVTTERSSTRANAGIISARHLSDTALNLVIAQIREATSGYKPGTQTSDETLTWATQPGVIRTFNGTTGNRKSTGNGSYDLTYSPGDADFVFKLYSAEKLTVKATDYEKATSGDLGAEVKFIENYDPTALDVSAKPELGDYVDLNEPFYVPALSGEAQNDTTIVEPRYPILDPRAKANLTNGTFVSGNGYGSVDGFDCKPFKHPKLNYLARSISGSYTKQPVPLLPMPVRWLYQLKDGTLVPSVNGRIVGATKDNPIVGRVAFWTDDETCKLNINTASEGTYWATPTASSREESGEVTRGGQLVTRDPLQSANLAASQPVRGEYQRYPGHPATTCLSPVLGWLWNIDPNIPTSQRPITEEFKEAMASITPFMPVGSVRDRPPHKLGSVTSMGGYQNPDPYVPDINTLKPGEITILNQPTRYLRATVDELLFDAERFPRNKSLQAGADNPLATLAGKGRITSDALERVRGFLTAVSRAPDLNGYGRPRVNFWPVNAEAQFRTSYDELFAFTSTINASSRQDTGPRAPKPFYFTRWDARCNENDLFVEAKNPSGRTPQLIQILRDQQQNRAMLRYLAFLTGDSDYGTPVLSHIPGFGGSLGAKYYHPNQDPRLGASERPTEMSQILTEILDYVRTVNISDSGQGKNAGTYRPFTPRFFTRANTDGYSRVERSSDGSGQVTPLITRGKSAARTGVPGTQGMGRFLTMSDAAIMFYRTLTTAIPAQNGQPAQAAQPAIQAALIMQMATTMPNFPAIRDTFFTKVREIEGTRNRIKVGASPNFQDLKFSTLPLLNVNNIAAHEVGYGRGFMPTLGFLSQFNYFPPHTAPTTVNNGAGRNIAFTVAQKTITNDLVKFPEMGTYVRGKTERIYPYVSDPVPIRVGNADAADFEWIGGAFEAEIWAGEAPDDPSARLVQTIRFKFPSQPIKFGMVTTASTPLQARITGSLNGDWNIFNDGDVIRGVEYVGSNAAVGGSPFPTIAMQGDLRHAACQSFLDESNYAHRDASLGGGQYFTPTRRLLHALRTSHGDPTSGFSSTSRGALATGSGPTIRQSKPPILPAGINGVRTFSGVPGDFDRGLSKHMSGAFGNKVDEGNIYFGYGDSTLSGLLPYYRGRAIEETGQSFFSPNRQLPSAVMFGSLPTGVFARRPWQTLLFRPNRSAADHYGADVLERGQRQPPDYHLLDLFHLPVIEPFAVSEPFSTAGKVNLNYVMAPFGYAAGGPGSNPGGTNPRSYIRRDTALRGILKAVKVMMVPTAQPDNGHTEQPLQIYQCFRHDIDLELTLGTLEGRLKDPQRGLYRSAAEICNVDLVPQPTPQSSPPSVVPWGGGKPASWQSFWETSYAMTGDNMRELPYAHIYPRVTTKSNVFTVHMRCQAIRKAPNTDPEVFEEGKDAIVGEYRGNSVIERFIDPNDPKLEDYDYTKRDATGRLDPYYRFRILSSKQFTAH